MCSGVEGGGRGPYGIEGCVRRAKIGASAARWHRGVHRARKNRVSLSPMQQRMSMTPICMCCEGVPTTWRRHGADMARHGPDSARRCADMLPTRPDVFSEVGVVARDWQQAIQSQALRARRRR